MKADVYSFQSQSAYGVGNEGGARACIIGKHGIESCLVLPRNEVEQCRLEASAIKLNEAYQTAFENVTRSRTVAEQPLRHFWHRLAVIVFAGVSLKFLPISNKELWVMLKLLDQINNLLMLGYLPVHVPKSFRSEWISHHLERYRQCLYQYCLSD